ncbi:hypothetical protein N7488_012127 [Penicillium malachiteum]|nr:hypothetical protein N7488_012127 [Penicillium malachiteum]
MNLCTAVDIAGNIAQDRTSATVAPVVASTVVAEGIAVKDIQDAAGSIVGDTEVKDHRPAAGHTVGTAGDIAEDMIDLEGTVPEIHFGYVVVVAVLVGCYIAA